MALRTYSDLLEAFPKAHLVVATVGQEMDRLKPAAELLARLVSALKPKGDYALGELQDGQGFAVHCVFERAEDAGKLGEAVQAKIVGRYPGHASQRAFALNEDAQEAIEAALDDLDSGGV